ncbi:MAG: hypothetical protein AAF618_04595, partial [Pseudomonadota bacterium]
GLSRHARPLGDDMTLEGAVFAFVSAVTLLVTGGIGALMLRNARRGLKRLKHHEAALPEVMTGRYLTFFLLTAMAVAHGDLVVMCGLQIAFLLASLYDTALYLRRGAPFGSHLMAAFASAVAAGLCAYVLLQPA